MSKNIITSFKTNAWNSWSGTNDKNLTASIKYLNLNRTKGNHLTLSSNFVNLNQNNFENCSLILKLLSPNLESYCIIFL